MAQETQIALATAAPTITQALLDKFLTAVNNSTLDSNTKALLVNAGIRSLGSTMAHLVTNIVLNLFLTRLQTNVPVALVLSVLTAAIDFGVNASFEDFIARTALCAAAFAGGSLIWSAVSRMQGPREPQRHAGYDRLRDDAAAPPPADRPAV